MHYIFPAADAALELQSRLQTYFNRAANPLMSEEAVRLRQRCHTEHTKQVARYYRDCAERLKAEIERTLRHLLTHRSLITDESIQTLGELYEQACAVAIVAKQRYQTSSETNLSQDQQWIDQIGAVLQTGFARLNKPTLFRLPPEMPKSHTFSRSECRRLIRALLEDELNAQMAWVSINPDTRSQIEQVLLDLIPLWDALNENLHPQLPPEHLEAWKDQIVRYCGEFYRQVIEPTQKKVISWVQNIIPYRTWDVWTVRELGWDLVLEKGEDFRVLDWERRMASGEWTHDAGSVHLTLNGSEMEAEQFERILDRDIQTTLTRLEQETRLGFSPLFFKPRLTETLTKPVDFTTEKNNDPAQPVSAIVVRKRGKKHASNRNPSRG